MQLTAINIIYIQEEMQYSQSLFSLEVKVERVVYMVHLNTFSGFIVYC